MAEYIEREELLRIEKLLDTEVLRASKTASNIYDQILYDIENFPAADVVPVVHGKWIRKEAEGAIFAEYECSVCSAYPTGGIKSRYCPNCGAKMDEED